MKSGVKPRNGVIALLKIEISYPSSRYVSFLSFFSRYLFRWRFIAKIFLLGYGDS